MSVSPASAPTDDERRRARNRGLLWLGLIAGLVALALVVVAVVQPNWDRIKTEFAGITANASDQPPADDFDALLAVLSGTDGDPETLDFIWSEAYQQGWTNDYRSPETAAIKVNEQPKSSECDLREPVGYKTTYYCSYDQPGTIYHIPDGPDALHELYHKYGAIGPVMAFGHGYGRHLQFITNDYRRIGSTGKVDITAYDLQAYCYAGVSTLFISDGQHADLGNVEAASRKLINDEQFRPGATTLETGSLPPGRHEAFMAGYKRGVVYCRDKWGSPTHRVKGASSVPATTAPAPSTTQPVPPATAGTELIKLPDWTVAVPSWYDVLRQSDSQVRLGIKAPPRLPVNGHLQTWDRQSIKGDDGLYDQYLRYMASRGVTEDIVLTQDKIGSITYRTVSGEDKTIPVSQLSPGSTVQVMRYNRPVNGPYVHGLFAWIYREQGQTLVIDLTEPGYWPKSWANLNQRLVQISVGITPS